MSQTIIAYGDAGTGQKVTEVIARASAKAANQLLVSHRKSPHPRPSREV